MESKHSSNDFLLDLLVLCNRYDWEINEVGNWTLQQTFIRRKLDLTLFFCQFWK